MVGKKQKIRIIFAIALLLFVTWIIFYIFGTKNQASNNYWKLLLAGEAVLGGYFGITTAKYWSWLKSEIGKGVFFLSLGLAIWGTAQAAWVLSDMTHFMGNYSYLLNVGDFLPIPFVLYGLIMLSKVTGANFALRKTINKIYVFFWAVITSALSYYFLVILDRGGLDYFKQNSPSQIFFDLGYSMLLSFMLIFALSIVWLTWKELGGKFKRPIFAIFLGFVCIYVGDFAYWYFSHKGQYYSGHWVDLFYMMTATLFSVALCMLAPATKPLLNVKPLQKLQNKTNYYSRYL